MIRRIPLLPPPYIHGLNRESMRLYHGTPDRCKIQSVMKNRHCRQRMIQLDFLCAASSKLTNSRYSQVPSTLSKRYTQNDIHDSSILTFIHLQHDIFCRQFYMSTVTITVPHLPAARFITCISLKKPRKCRDAHIP